MPSPDDRFEKAVRRDKRSCHSCGGALTRVQKPHPLGAPFVVLQCNSCGHEATYVRDDKGNLKKPGSGR